MCMGWKVIVAYLFSVLAFLFFVLALFPGAVTSFATSGAFSSNVTVENFFAIDLSANLNDGINFDEITSLPATNVNSTNNYDGAGSGSTMFVSVSSDSDATVDFCVRANSGLTDSTSGEVIQVSSESYANSSTTSLSSPSVSHEVSFSTSYALASAPVTPGSDSYYRFWLDASSGTPSGSYNNTINFKGVVTKNPC
jgi:hypothetical protein